MPVVASYRHKFEILQKYATVFQTPSQINRVIIVKGSLKKFFISL